MHTNSNAFQPYTACLFSALSPMRSHCAPSSPALKTDKFLKSAELKNRIYAPAKRLKQHIPIVYGAKTVRQKRKFNSYNRITPCMLRQYNQSTMRRRECELFSFAALSSLKYARYFCVLPPCKTGKFLFLCGRRFLLKSPLTAARRLVKDIPGVF